MREGKGAAAQQVLTQQAKNGTSFRRKSENIPLFLVKTKAAHDERQFECWNNAVEKLILFLASQLFSLKKRLLLACFSRV